MEYSVLDQAQCLFCREDLLELVECFINYPHGLSMCLFILMYVCVYTYKIHILNTRYAICILKGTEAVAKERNIHF